MWCADPWLISRRAAISCTVTRRFSYTMASTAAMASGVTTRCAWPGRGESVTELTPFRNFLLHSYTCYSDRHALPYRTSIRRWISIGFTPSARKKNEWPNAVPLWCMLQVGPPFLHYCWRIAFLYRTATCRQLIKPRVLLLPTYRTIERCFEFLSQF